MSEAQRKRAREEEEDAGHGSMSFGEHRNVSSTSHLASSSNANRHPETNPVSPSPNLPASLSAMAAFSVYDPPELRLG